MLDAQLGRHTRWSPGFPPVQRLPMLQHRAEHADQFPRKGSEGLALTKLELQGM